jgi:UDP-glucose 4-epimerase
MQGKRVLVTGAAGFIGSNIANSLADENEVVGVDDGYLGDPANLDDAVEFHDASVLDDDLPTDVDVVFHLAALSSYAMHEETPTLGARVNVEGFVNVVDQARQDGCDTVVYASTSYVYGSQSDPTPEETPVSVESGYIASKVARESYGEYFHEHYGISTAAMRYYSVYQGYGGGEGHKGEYANLIAQFADDVANDRRPEIWGDGTQTRDFTHVSDVVRATVAAADHELQGAYNVGTGDQHSLNELVAELNERFDKDVEPVYAENQMGDAYVHHSCADYSKLHDATGWEPQIAFDEGLDRVCAQYLREHTLNS